MHELTNLELESFTMPPSVCVRLTTLSGRQVVLPARIMTEDRVVPSNGTEGLDRVEVLIAGESLWLERRDLCDEDGEPIVWMPYELEE